MAALEPAIRHISDTAIWAAMYRAAETDRTQPLFRDPFARRLAGARGVAIAGTMRHQDRHAWAWVMRTVLFDRVIEEQVRAGVDTVVNLAAGLDARPYRMALPSTLRWFEVDLPDLVAYKTDALKGEQPRCRLERVALDVADASARRELFARIGAVGTNTLVVTEGLLIYLTAEAVVALGQDLAAPPSFRHWALDVASPGLLTLMQKEIGKTLDEAGAPFKFAPEEGPAFFERAGWTPVAVHSPLQTAAAFHRLPLFLRFIALFPEPARPGRRPWSGICLFEKRTG